MTNRSSFELENMRHACHFVVGAWLSNFCHDFSSPLGTLSFKVESLRKRQEVLRIEEKRGEKIAAGLKEDMTVFVVVV